LQVVGVIALIAIIAAIVWYAQRMYRKSEETFAAEQLVAATPLPPMPLPPCAELPVPSAHGSQPSSALVTPATTRKETTKTKTPKLVPFAIEDAA